MPVPNSMADLSTLASSNFPTGTESIGNNLDNYIRSISAILRSTYGIASATIASASTVDLGSADNEFVTVTGTSTINSFGTAYAGCKRQVRFSGTLTIANSSNILLPYGASLTVSANDVLEFRCTSPGVWVLCSSWRDIGAVRVAGDTMTGGLSIVSQGSGIVLGFRDSGNTVTRYFISHDNTSWSFNNMNDAGAYSGTPMRIYRNNTGVDFSGIVKSLGTSSGLAFDDRSGGNQWAWYSTGGTARLNRASDGDKLTCDTAGNFNATGNVTGGSDESVKSNWRDLPSDLVDQLAAMEKVGTYDRTDIGTTQTGVGAQSLQKILPFTVQAGEDGFLSVAYGNAALVGVVATARRLLALEARVERIGGS